MAEFFFWQDLMKTGRETGQFDIASAATSAEEIGNGVLGNSVNLGPSGNFLCRKDGSSDDKGDYNRYDYLIGMDSQPAQYVPHLRRRSGGEKYFACWISRGRPVMADPWYTGDFEATYRDIRRAVKDLLRISEKRMRFVSFEKQKGIFE